MRPYLAYFAARFRAQLQYRAAALAGIGTQIFFGIVNVMVLLAFYHSSNAPQPLSLAQSMSYVWLAQSLLLILPFRVDSELSHLIESGNVAYELARPVKLPLVWMVRGLADRSAPVLLRALPQIIFSAFVLRWLGWEEAALGPPASAMAGMLAGLSVLAGVAVSASIALVASSTLFWTIAGRGTSVIFTTLIWIFSGITIPLPLFPDWFQPVIHALPFRGMLDVPFQIYLGTIAGQQIAPQIVSQIVWAIALFALAWLLIGRGTRRVVVQGG